MKTTKILGTTTLAGALLFTGVGATHSNEAHADTQEITLPTPSEWQTQHDKMVQAKAEHPNQGGEGGGPGAITSYDKSYEEYIQKTLDYERKYGNVDFKIPQEGKAYLNGQDSDNSNNQQSSQNNDQQAQNQATDNNVSTQNNDQQQTQTTDNNTTTQTNTQEQAKVLPETGESSNTTILTIVASILLAAGSLLTFKRFSKTSK